MQNKLNSILLNKHLSDIDKNNLILDLAEARDVNLYENILEYLSKSQESKYKSVLVYALTFYPPEPLLEKAIARLITGNFDVAHSAFNILNSIEEISGEQVDKSFNDLTLSLKDIHEEWRVELINEILSMFN